MGQNNSEGLTEAVNNLSGEIAGLRGETQELHDYGRENRRLIRRQNRIILGVILVALAVGVVGVIAIRGANEARAAAQQARAAAEQARAAAEQAQRNAVNAEEVCRQGNIARATTRDLWEGLFKLPSITALSPAEQATRDAQVAVVRARIATSYADQDCTKFGPQPVKK